MDLFRLKAINPQQMSMEIESLTTRISEVEAGRESYRTRFLEEREAKKFLEEDIKRVQKECRAKLSMMSTDPES
jgi:DNA repair exonuclease SbcCD ATPase subunit